MYARHRADSDEDGDRRARGRRAPRQCASEMELHTRRSCVPAMGLHTADGAACRRWAPGQTPEVEAEAPGRAKPAMARTAAPVQVSRGRARRCCGGGPRCRGMQTELQVDAEVQQRRCTSMRTGTARQRRCSCMPKQMGLHVNADAAACPCRWGCTSTQTGTARQCRCSCMSMQMGMHVVGPEWASSSMAMRVGDRGGAR